MRITVPVLSAAAAAAVLVSGASLAAASPAAARTEHIQEISASTTAPKLSVVMYGPVTAAGTVVETSATASHYTLAGGTFTATSKLTGGRQQLNRATCTLTGVHHVSYTIGHGAGRYKGISGSGKATVTFIVLEGRTAHGACTTSHIKGQQYVIRASGPVTLP
jgi:hypothetical protein